MTYSFFQTVMSNMPCKDTPREPHVTAKIFCEGLGCLGAWGWGCPSLVEVKEGLGFI